MDEYIYSQSPSAKWLLDNYGSKNISQYANVIKSWIQHINIVDALCHPKTGCNLYLSLHSALLAKSLTTIDIYYIPELLTYISCKNIADFHLICEGLSSQDMSCQCVFIPSEHENDIALTYDNTDGSAWRFITIAKQYLDLSCTMSSDIPHVPLLIIFKKDKAYQNRQHNIKEFMASVDTNIGARIGLPPILRSASNINGSCVSYLLVDAY
jgi:hypothetical protein